MNINAIFTPPPQPAGQSPAAMRTWYLQMHQSVASCVATLRTLDFPKRTAIAPRDALGGGAGLDLSTCRLGYSISGTTCTLKAGAINFYGKQQVSVAESSFALAGTQYAYVHHVRGSGAAAWATAGAEPGVGSTTDMDVTCFKFLNGAISIIYRIGDINFDLPLA